MTKEEREETSFLPVNDPAYVAQFVHEYFSELDREARKLCRKQNIADFADDALSITIEKFMTSRIEDRGPRSGIAFAMKIIKNTCIDELRRRGRHAVLAGGMTGDLGGDDEHAGPWVPEPKAVSDPEVNLMAELELFATSLGFEHLPLYMAATHKNVSRDLDIVRRRYLLSMTWEEIAEEMDVDATHRQSAARGRELLRGWVHALSESRPEPDAVNRKYWQRGFEAALKFKEESDLWKPNGRRV